MQAIADNMLLKFPEFMASSNVKSDSQRPQPLKVSRSFPRVEPNSPDRSNRDHRASTIQNGVTPEGVIADKREDAKSKMQPDVFEKSPEGGDDHGAGEEIGGKLPADFDELPIELVSLTDRSVSTLFQ